MRIRNLFFILLICVSGVIFGQGNEIKNIIILIPDGTSSSLLTLSRWYNGNQALAVDGIICGMVKTHNKDNKFPDSAPTSTAYSTGVKSVAPFIGIDSEGKPQISVMEIARLKGMSTGVVVSSEFPHATPADFVCHFNSRDGYEYRTLSKQFVYNSPSLVFAGGYNYLHTNNLTDVLRERGFSIIRDLESFRNNNKDSVWGIIFRL